MSRSKTESASDPQRSQRIRDRVITIISIVLLVGMLGGGYFFSRRYVTQKVAVAAQAPRIVLANRPAWMSDGLAAQIAQSAQPRGTYSVFDHQVLVDVSKTLASNGWIKNVKQVRRSFQNQPGDTIQIDCDYRVPMALAKWNDVYWLVDTEGCRLSEKYTPVQASRILLGKDGKPNLRIVEGMQSPPPEAGQKWAGNELCAGIELLKVIADQPCGNDILKVDVSNFNGRRDVRDPHLVLVTRWGTQIRWGRPVSATDAFVEVPPAQKLATLQRIAEQFGRIDARVPWVDIRFDRITYPRPDTGGARADNRR